jgi:hypothetical protein
VKHAIASCVDFSRTVAGFQAYTFFGLCDPHDGSAGYVVEPSQGTDGDTSFMFGDDVGALVWRGVDRPAQRLAFLLCTRQACLSTLYKQIPLHFGYHSLHGHHLLAGGGRQVQLAQMQNNDLDQARSQCFDGSADIQSIPTQPVQLRNHQGWFWFLKVKSA